MTVRQMDAEVLETEEITPGTFVTWYAGEELCRAAQPGQFVMVLPREGMDPFLPRAFSFYRFRERGGERQFALLYAVVGEATALMASQRAGESARMTGPLGAWLRGAEQCAQSAAAGGRGGNRAAGGAGG